MHMLRMIRQLLAFRVGQTSAKTAARLVGLGRLGMVIGLIGGYRALKRYRHA
jgi:hypothetical protein